MGDSKADEESLRGSKSLNPRSKIGMIALLSRLKWTKSWAKLKLLYLPEKSRFPHSWEVFASFFANRQIWIITKWKKLHSFTFIQLKEFFHTILHFKNTYIEESQVIVNHLL